MPYYAELSIEDLESILQSNMAMRKHIASTLCSIPPSTPEHKVLIEEHKLIRSKLVTISQILHAKLEVETHRQLLKQMMKPM